jgi:peptidoglycan/xylan/chitin deacetylase (PgdA/CDA1 family)
VRNAYKPISIPELIEGLTKGVVPDSSVAITTDDAHLDVYDVAVEFSNFGVPLAVFVCPGWVALQDWSESDALIRAVNAIQWYEGTDARISFGKIFSCELSASRKSANIDWVLSEQALLLPHLEELCIKINALTKPAPRRSICNWSELRKLSSLGVYIGAHSVSHVPISQMSAIRRRFEICESKSVIDRKIGSCTTFAYPYGIRGTYDDSTHAELKAAGFEGAFLTHSDVITASSPAFGLPRISLPDVPMPLFEFKARVRGGGIPLRLLKEIVRGTRHSK